MILRSFIMILMITFFIVEPIPVASSISYSQVQTVASFKPVFQKGMSYTTYANLTPNAYSTASSDESLKYMKQKGVDWVAINVVGWYQTNNRSADIHKNQSQAPTDTALCHVIQRAHNLNMNVMLKPMIDLEDGRWRGEIQPSEAWFQNYTNYIEFFANFAQQNNVEMLCIGTELKQTVSDEAQWRNIISVSRECYSGLITYAADWWREYDELIKWWDAVDYVGIDAYFPLSNKNNPTITEIKNTWNNVTNYLDAFYSKVKKPIIFTEIGYLSTDGTNQNPSNYRLQNVPGRLIDLQEQADCYEAAFQALWEKNWFYGFYWWYWQTNPDAGGANNSDYTPQNKPAQNVITHYYLTQNPNDILYYIIGGVSLAAIVTSIIIVVIWRKRAHTIKTGSFVGSQRCNCRLLHSLLVR